MGSANVVVTENDDGDGFWMAADEVDHAQIGSAEPDPLLDDPDDSEEVACAHTEGAEIDLQWSSPDDWLCDDWVDPLFGEEMACAIITPVEQDSAPRVELYDSGATRHISPYKPDFMSYSPLSPFTTRLPQTSSTSRPLGPEP